MLDVLKSFIKNLVTAKSVDLTSDYMILSDHCFYPTDLTIMFPRVHCSPCDSFTV